jgi:hypothetical protein
MSNEEIISTDDEVVVEEKSMEDTIAETLADIESRGESEPEETETEQEAADRIRDEKGRFAKKEEPEPVAQEVIEPEPVIPVGVPPELQRLGLRKEEAEAMALAPEAVRNAFIRRSEEMHKGLETYREKAQIGERMLQSLQPFMPTIQALGVDPGEATARLFNVEHTLRFGNQQQKLAMIHQVMSEYGINPDDAYTYTQNAPAAPQADPQVAQLYQYVQQLEQKQTQLLNQQQQREMETLNSEISRFSADKPHFDSVRNEMAALLQAGIATDLQSAYEQAIYANPQVRAQVLAAQQAEQEEKRKQESNVKAQAAKKSASVNVPRKGIMGAQRPIGSMDETIRETAQKLGIL